LADVAAARPPVGARLAAPREGFAVDARLHLARQRSDVFVCWRVVCVGAVGPVAVPQPERDDLASGGYGGDGGVVRLAGVAQARGPVEVE
jgi:hypothetical protein